jgi:hypothetical protein
VLRDAARLVRMPQRELRFAKEGHPRLGRRHALAAPLQQARGQFAFEPADLLAECGLHQLQVRCRPANAAEFHDPDEVAKLSQFHRVTFGHVSLIAPVIMRQLGGAAPSRRS